MPKVTNMIRPIERKALMASSSSAVSNGPHRKSETSSQRSHRFEDEFTSARRDGPGESARQSKMNHIDRNRSRNEKDGNPNDRGRELSDKEINLKSKNPDSLKSSESVLKEKNVNSEKDNDNLEALAASESFSKDESPNIMSSRSELSNENQSFVAVVEADSREVRSDPEQIASRLATSDFLGKSHAGNENDIADDNEFRNDRNAQFDTGDDEAFLAASSSEMSKLISGSNSAVPQSPNGKDARAQAHLSTFTAARPSDTHPSLSAVQNDIGSEAELASAKAMIEPGQSPVQAAAQLRMNPSLGSGDVGQARPPTDRVAAQASSPAQQEPYPKTLGVSTTHGGASPALMAKSDLNLGSAQIAGEAHAKEGLDDPKITSYFHGKSRQDAEGSKHPVNTPYGAQAANTALMQKAPNSGSLEARSSAAALSQIAPALGSQDSLQGPEPDALEEIAQVTRYEPGFSALPGRRAAALGPVAPQPVMQQIAEAIRADKAGIIDLRLEPEELGRLRIQITAGEAGLSVQILGDRADTVDLLKRHASVLDRVFAQEGLDLRNAAFGMSSGSGSPPSQEPVQPDTLAEPGPDADPSDASSVPSQTSRSAGLDLRM